MKEEEGLEEGRRFEGERGFRGGGKKGSGKGLEEVTREEGGGRVWKRGGGKKGEEVWKMEGGFGRGEEGRRDERGEDGRRDERGRKVWKRGGGMKGEEGCGRVDEG